VKLRLEKVRIKNRGHIVFFIVGVPEFYRIKVGIPEG
jgi:hypothetical protein